MARTTSEAVRELLSGNYNCNEGTNLAPFIASATDLVDNVVSCAITKGASLSTTTQELVERWLAGYFYALTDLMAQSKSTGAASATFQGKTDLGLNANYYGQTAMLLDTSRCLAAMNKEIAEGSKKTVQMVWLGKDPPDQDNPNTFIGRGFTNATN